LDVRLADLVAALEGGLEDAAGEQGPDGGADERGPLARLDVLELDDLERFPVHLDLQALAEFRRLDDAGHGGSLPWKVPLLTPRVCPGLELCLHLGGGDAEDVPALAVVALRLHRQHQEVLRADQAHQGDHPLRADRHLGDRAGPQALGGSADLREHVGVLHPGRLEIHLRRVVRLVGLHRDPVEAHHAAREGAGDLIHHRLQMGEEGHEASLARPYLHVKENDSCELPQGPASVGTAGAVHAGKTGVLFTTRTGKTTTGVFILVSALVEPRTFPSKLKVIFRVSSPPLGTELASIVPAAVLSIWNWMKPSVLPGDTTKKMGSSASATVGPLWSA